MPDLLPVDAALDNILKSVTPVNTIDNIALDDASGRVLAQNITASIHVPPADNSAMDGYAINTADLSTEETTTLNISQRITAGEQARQLAPHTAARIFTGAEIPMGANAVVMQEQCKAENNTLSCPSDIKAGNNIRKKGQDINAGDIILKQGKVLQPQDIGLLASIGIAEVPVFRKLTVAILSTGDELIEPGKPLPAGKIYNSNRFLLKSFLKRNQINIIDLKSVEDNLDATKALLAEGAQADCIISTGGVSVGEEDYVKKAVDDLGQLTLWRIAMKPGKPLAFGRVTQTPFFGLPGNPVSAFTTFCLFVQPFLRRLQGQQQVHYRQQKMTADFTMQANPIRQEYIRIKVDGDRVSAFSNQSSGVLSSTTWADGLAIMRPKQDIHVGSPVDVLLFNELIP